MSQILDFYRGTGTGAGRTFEQALALDNVSWEAVHDLVQWVFPLPEPSKAQPQSPVMTTEDIAEFRSDDELRERVIWAYDRWMAFLFGTTQWKRPKDHNHLRITRVIRFLTLIGMHGEAGAVCRIADEATEGIVPDITIWYWQEAMGDNPAWLKIRALED